jgi:hypothetical protein
MYRKVTFFYSLYSQKLSLISAESALDFPQSDHLGFSDTDKDTLSKPHSLEKKFFSSISNFNMVAKISKNTAKIGSQTGLHSQSKFQKAADATITSTFEIPSGGLGGDQS